MATAKVLVLGGGGGGGSDPGSALNSGGGGAGGYQYNATYTITPQTYSVTVGASVAVATVGNNSIFDSITAYGGGRGGGSGGTSTLLNGGCGGGNATAGAGGTGSQGGNGGNYSGGGGGTSQNGANSSGAGGNGTSNSISGSAITYGGGGGGANNGGAGGAGGTGGGGAGGSNNAGAGGVGTNGLGGGGGGGAFNNGVGGGGGSGIVIVRWTTSDFGTCSVTGAGNAITTNGADSIATMIVSGNLVIVAGATAPTVTTQAVSSITSTTATGNGNITVLGGLNAYQRGFAYVPGSSGDITFMNFDNNNSFESAITTWGGAGDFALSTTQVKYGTYSGKLTFVSGGEAYRDFTFTPSLLAGKTVTFGAWIWSSVAGIAGLSLIDNNGIDYSGANSPRHTGSSTWEWITISYTYRTGITWADVRLTWAGGTAGSAYFDGLVMAVSPNATAPVIAFDSSSYGTGAYTKGLTGLLRNTAYRVTAFASNSIGTSYGATVGLTTQTGIQINIGDVWKQTTGMQINIGDVWKPVTKVQINIGDVWKTIF